MGDLAETVVMVTGASRGIGKGIALGFGEAGATVYVTGRSTDTNRAQLAGTIDETAAEVTRRGGRGIAMPCDHHIDSDVAAAFDQLAREQGRLDVLVNNAFASPDQRVQWSGLPFWEIPAALWDDLIAVGLRSHFVASQNAVPLMLAHDGGLILNVASRYSLEGNAHVARDSSVLGRQGRSTSADRGHGGRTSRSSDRGYRDLAARDENRRRGRAS
jgi:dehydrogenase/reductase SDR family protein 1